MADLLAIRTRLVNESGRFDLVTDAEGADYTDAGANQLINDAIEWLNEIRFDLQTVLSTESFVLLATDTDENYWSTEKPHILVNAARRMLEVRQRNTTGVGDWDRIIHDDIHRIYANETKAAIDTLITADEANREMQG